MSYKINEDIKQESGSAKIYIIEGHEFEWSDKKLVTSKFYKADFEQIIKKELDNYTCGVSFEVWEYGAEIAHMLFQDKNSVNLDKFEGMGCK